MTYSYDGFEKYTLTDDMYYHKDGMIWKGERVEIENPRWVFSFSKYMEKYQPQKPDCVSFLMGGNDLQVVDYEDSDRVVSEFISNIEKFIASVREYDEKIKIIINLPIPGADQLSWGKKMGCMGTAKQYRFNCIKATKAILDKWGKSEDNIYISSMLLNLDTKSGFDAEMYRASLYSDKLLSGHGNWVHPNSAGYMQMGDALAAVIEHIR